MPRQQAVMKADMSATARYHYLHIPSGNGAAIRGRNGSGKHWLRQCRLVWNPWIIGALQHQYRDGGILQAAMDAGTGITGIAVTIAGKPRGYMTSNSTMLLAAIAARNNAGSISGMAAAMRFRPASM